jgi:hypothetical protein
MKIDTPREDQVAAVTSYYSGHYACYGINAMACCDFNSSFTSFSLESPGGTGDSIAFARWSLSRICELFALGEYVIGDNTFTNGRFMLTPYTKVQMNQKRSNYNFFISQLRIHIEMAFGLLTSKWRIFKRPLNTSLSTAVRIAHVCFRLHNFCID